MKNVVTAAADKLIALNDRDFAEIDFLRSIIHAKHETLLSLPRDSAEFTALWTEYKALFKSVNGYTPHLPR